jgi:hypothetical protein
MLKEFFLMLVFALLYTTFLLHWKDEELYYANHKADISGSRVTYREIEEIQESGEEEEP